MPQTVADILADPLCPDWIKTGIASLRANNPNYAAFLEAMHDHIAIRREALRLAKVRLHQALDCPRFGIDRTLTLEGAADYFRQAGMPDYADRAEIAAHELTDHDVALMRDELESVE
jgi:hypothetical protein